MTVRSVKCVKIVFRPTILIYQLADTLEPKDKLDQQPTNAQEKKKIGDIGGKTKRC